MGKLTYKTEKQGENTIFYLTGKIDEDFRRKDIELNDLKKVTFNFRDLTMINSCGIREWIDFLKSQPNDMAINYEECTPIIVTQMNIISGFLRPNIKVLSFYAPYFDPSDDTESMHLIQSKDITATLPPVVKNEKGDQLDFDAHPEKYFHFLKIQDNK
ncbi:MAG: hypothetical protein H0V66_11710 [Bdellovibrionales bacterium]|nr:hypothetical protein [Bdellovibrionales bacterium]